jgi:hypothetical protein
MTDDELAPPEERGSSRPREFDAALRDLNACIERIHALIPRVNAMIERRTNSLRSQPRARVLYGGGPSAFAAGQQSDAAVPRARQLRPQIVATDLALAGYSIEQIRERVQDFDRLAVNKALEETFE